MNIIPIIVSRDILITCVSTLTTSISSTQQLYNFIMNYSISNNDYKLYQNKLLSADLSTKLSIMNAVIGDIIRKQNIIDGIELDSGVNSLIINHKNTLNIIDDDGFDIVTNVDNINLIERLPKTIKVSIHSNIDIINKINQTLNSIQDKIQKYNAAYFSYFYRLNIHDDVENIILYCDIFDKRLSMLLDILKLYYK
jgi:hypothetical protein